ncbi:unnamed protein product [Scytosiphon promiscuus]
MPYRRGNGTGPRISYTKRSSPIGINGEGRERGGLTHRTDPAAEPERLSPSPAHAGQEAELCFELELDYPQLEGREEDHQGRIRDGSEEDFDGDNGEGSIAGGANSKGGNGSLGGGGGGGGGNGGGPGDILFSPAYKASPARAGPNGGGGGEGWRGSSAGSSDHDGGGDGWAIGTGRVEAADGDDDGGGCSSSGGAVCIGGGGWSGNSSGFGLGMVTTEELRGDEGGYTGGLGDEDWAFGKSQEEGSFLGSKLDNFYRQAEARNVRSSKSRGLGRGGSSGSLAGRDGGTGGGGRASGSSSTRGGAGIARKGNKNFKDSHSSSTKSAPPSGGRKGSIKEKLDFYDGLAGSATKINRSRSLLPNERKQPFSQADTANARKNKDRQRSQEVKRAIKDKGARYDADKTAEGGVLLLWETSGGGVTTATGTASAASTSAGNWGDGTCLSHAWLSAGQTSTETLESIRGNRPHDSKVRKAQTILARALRKGGKRVLLPGLDLRYPQNVAALLEDAAQAWEHGLHHRRKATVSGVGSDATGTGDALLAWTQSWSPVQVMDLSRNDLQGIDSLLVVEAPCAAGDDRAADAPETPQGAPWDDGPVGPVGDGGAAAGGRRRGRQRAASTTTKLTFPLAGLQELRLNGNQLHGLPGDMARVLPSLVKLELYGNQIEEIKTPLPGPLRALKHLNLGCNNLLELPAEACVAMPSLEKLLLADNLLEWLPRELAGLRHLKVLDVSRNPLTSPPVEVAARGLDSVKRYFRDVEVQNRDDDGVAEARHVEVPNQVKVIFIGHQEAGKSDVIKGLVPDRPALPEPQPGFRDGSTSNDNGNARPVSTSYTTTIGGGGGSGGSTPFASASGAAVTTPSSHQRRLQQGQVRGRGVPPRTPTRAPQPPSSSSASPLQTDKRNETAQGFGDGGGWQVVGMGRQRSGRLPQTTPPKPPLLPNQSRERSETSASSTPGMGGLSSPATTAERVRRSEKVAGGGALGSGRREWAQGTGAAARDNAGAGGVSAAATTAGKSPSVPESPNQVAMAIQTATYTPTISYHKGRKHLTGEEWVAVDRGDNATDVETPRVSGNGGGGDADVRSITLKFWDFGGTEEFHAVHGLFFSGRALYTVVFDLRHVDRDEIDERVQFWIDCVQSRVPGSLIVLVGTHADCMTEEEAQSRIKKVREQLEQNEQRIVSGLRSSTEGTSHAAAGLSHLKNRPKIEPQVFAVSSKHHQGYEDFLQQVLNLAGDAKRFPPSRLPPTWVEADRLVKLRREQGHRIVSVRNLVAGLRDGSGSGSVSGKGSGTERSSSSHPTWSAVAAGSGSGESQSEEDCRNAVVSTLEWLNDTSEVVYFNKPGLDEFVILHPLHLMSAIKEIVRPDLKEKLSTLVRSHQERIHRVGSAPASTAMATTTPAVAAVTPSTTTTITTNTTNNTSPRAGPMSTLLPSAPPCPEGFPALALASTTIVPSGGSGVRRSSTRGSIGRSSSNNSNNSIGRSSSNNSNNSMGRSSSNNSSGSGVGGVNRNKSSGSGGGGGSSNRSSADGRTKGDSDRAAGGRSQAGAGAAAEEAAPASRFSSEQRATGGGRSSGGSARAVGGLGAWSGGRVVGLSGLGGGKIPEAGGGGNAVSPRGKEAQAMSRVPARSSASSSRQHAGDPSKPSPLSSPKTPPASTPASSSLVATPTDISSGARPSYLETLAAGTSIGAKSAAAAPAGGNPSGAGGSGAPTSLGVSGVGARGALSGGGGSTTGKGSSAVVPEGVLTYRDEARLDVGFVSRAVVDALLEPLAEFKCDKSGREFLIRLFQESCVLVKATGEPPARTDSLSSAGKAEGKGLHLQQPRPVSRSQSLGSGSSLPSAASKARKEQEVEYFIPCVLPNQPVEWTESWVTRVHCGRRWCFQRFVPPSLMSALISRFYGMGKKGTACLSQRSIYIKVPIGGSGTNSNSNRRGSKRRRGEAEVFLKLHRGNQRNASRPTQHPRLELLAQAETHRREDLMRGLEPLIKEVDKTLGEFPGLLVERRVPCPACMEKKPANPGAWGGWPLEKLTLIESDVNCPEDLTICSFKCRLQDLQKRLLFVGEWHPDGEDSDDSGQTGGIGHYPYNVWDSPFPELGAPSTIHGEEIDGVPYRGFGVPRVDSLYPAVCPIAIYDLVARRVKYHATAFIVDAKKGHLLTAGHTFVKYKPEKKQDGGENDCCPRGEWEYCGGIKPENCIVLVGMFQPPYTTQWEYVAEAWQHSALVRSRIYANIGWNKDHPMLLKIKIRFNPISTRVVNGLRFEGLTQQWRKRVPAGGSVPEMSCDQRQQQQQQHQHQHHRPQAVSLTAISLGESRMVRNRPEGEVEHLTISSKDMLAVLKDTTNDICMARTVFPQELLTLVAFPEHAYPYYSSVSVTHGPVSRNMVAQDVIEVLLSNHRGASGGPVISKRGEAVGILSQGSQFGAYVMGISTAKTILAAHTDDLEDILTARPLLQMWEDAYIAQDAAVGARAAAAKADGAGALNAE